MFDFQKLEVYKKAKTFHRSCKKLIAEHAFDKYVNDQLSRASFSVILNIAEGSGKFSKRDRRNFFVISRASIFECVAALDVIHDDQLISDQEFTELQLQADEISRIMFAMVRNLQ